MVDIAQAAAHVKDADAFHVPVVLWQYLPAWMHGEHPHPGSIPLPEVLGLQLTKFMVLEVVAALLMLLVFVPLARRVSKGTPVRGRLANLFEAMLMFIRDEVARPAIGKHDADRFLPLIWTVFFFILFCNLLGMLPWAGSPTGALGVTAALAGIMFCTTVGAGMRKFGPVGFVTGQAPHMELPRALAIGLMPVMWMIVVIEIGGICIKHSVLAIRLLANMFAGHLVLGVIVGFIGVYAHSLLWYGIMPASVLGAAALSLLELLVAFLQAYIFAFLASLFIGMAIHQH